MRRVSKVITDNQCKNIYSNNAKILKERAKYRVYCKCGHSMLIYPFEHKDKKICKHCGCYAYRNELVKFKDILIQKRKEVEV